ncbi:MAG: AmmeMemoRadiSam system protein B [Desulfobulbaceae bacterium]
MNGGRMRLLYSLAAIACVGALLLGSGVLRGREGKEPGAEATMRQLPVRPPRGAGSFYPAEEKELAALVDELMARGNRLDLPHVHGVLVPHAGYVYSGPVAASAIRELPREIERVFILAANHNGNADFSGVSVPEVSGYAVPGSVVPLSPLVDVLRRDSLFTTVPAVHTGYMIEVELPFLLARMGKRKKPQFSIVPMIAGRLDASQVNHLAEVLHRYADEKTAFVFSVDLSHFYPDATARRLDAATIDAILSRDLERLSRATTDGNQVLMTMVTLAGLGGWDATLLRYANSGDASGDRQRVVGYAGIAFHEPVRFTREQERLLLDLARRSIAAYLETGKRMEVDREAIRGHALLGIPRGVFVTLKKKGRLRGCIGDLVSDRPLYEGVAHFAVEAAVHDPRFTPVTREELSGLDISISVLEYPRRLKVDDPARYPALLTPGRDGVILLHKGRRSTYLPQVWEELPDPVQFLSRLCMKQGAEPDCWQRPETGVFRYSAYEFGEREKKDS